MTVKAMKAGAVEFLTKPVCEQDLLALSEPRSKATALGASARTKNAICAAGSMRSTLGSGRLLPW
jgi:FixJ family two-component response regulator